MQGEEVNEFEFPPACMHEEKYTHCVTPDIKLLVLLEQLC